jgi:protein TonB
MSSVCKLLWCTAGFLIAVTPAQSAPAQSGTTAPDSYRKYAIATPKPAYPLEARLDDLEGSGVARLTIDRQSGRVISATMLQSTGHKILDEAALQAFRQWQFKPGVPFNVIRVPAVFKLKRPYAKSSRFPALIQGRALAVYAPGPDYPYEARARRMTGSGIAELQIDPKTGFVTKARMVVSIGHAVLDEAALKAFRQWHFKPGTETVRIPITYTMARLKY